MKHEAFKTTLAIGWKSYFIAAYILASKTNLVREISIYVCILKNKIMPVDRVGSILCLIQSHRHTHIHCEYYYESKAVQ